MTKTARVVRYLIVVVVTVAVVGLSAWYFFLSSRIDTQKQQDAARGYGADVPSFSSPTGSTYQNVLTEVSGGSVGSNSTSHGAVPTLWHISINPSAGVGFTHDGATEKLYFVERATGYVFNVNNQTGEIIRLTNTLIPKTYEAYVAGKNGVIVRTLSETGRLQTFLGTIPPTPIDSASSSPQALSGAYIETDIRDIAVHPRKQEFFYITFDPKAGPIGISRDWTGKTSKRVFSSALVGWLPLFASDGRLFVVQYSADNVAGFAYEIQNGETVPVIGNVPGLTFLPSPHSDAYIYGASQSGQVNLFAIRSRNTAPRILPIKTIADKCVWSNQKNIVYCAVPESLPSGNYLQNLHAGTLRTSDAWWEINIEEGSAALMHANAGAIYDVERPVMNAGGTAIAFVNAIDKSVWLLKIPSKTSNP